jgi:hypothetical protein
MNKPLKIIVCFIAALLLIPQLCSAIDLGEIGKTLGNAGVPDMLKSSGIDFSRITDYLNWETINVSLVSDFTNITELKRGKAVIDGRLYKSGINSMRVDLKSGIEAPGRNAIRLTDCYVLYHILKKQAYAVFPRKNAYIKIDPDEARELIGSFLKKHDGKPKIEKKEDLGMEAIDGHECKKIAALLKFPNGTKSNITAWLAQRLKGFPIKIVADFNTSQGIAGTNTTTFTNIEKTEPDEALFAIPGDYVKYDNLVEVATEGKLGSRLEKKPEGKRKLFKR